MGRNVFAELVEGFYSLAGERAGKVTVRSHKVEEEKPPSVPTMVELQTELQAYRDGLAHMVSQHDGEYVVIKGSRPVHFSTTYEAALNWAYDEYGLGRFLVKKVTENEGVAHW
jgi:hypothetical protein